MSTVKLLSDDEMDPRALAVCEDAKATLNLEDAPRFFRALAYHPDSLEAVWQRIKVLMDPTAPDHKTKHLIGLAVSAAMGSSYFSGHHAKALRREGATEAEIAEVLAVTELWSGLCTMVHGLGLEFEGPHQ